MMQNRMNQFSSFNNWVVFCT